MAITTGYSRYECDVKNCKNVNYATEGSEYAARYVQRTLIDSNGQTRVFTLCTSCAKEFDSMRQYWDGALSNFLVDGKSPYGSSSK